MNFSFYNSIFSWSLIDWSFIDTRVRRFKYRLFLNSKYNNTSFQSFLQFTFFHCPSVRLFCLKTLFFFQPSFLCFLPFVNQIFFSYVSLLFLFFLFSLINDFQNLNFF
uniref:Uncharacterized protein n=1 Tax=Codium arabicum TaxID=221038 RepID=A0A386B0L3_CODAR|nr:hypothetical protein [Codium arabicum]AYC65238.1 hypothetical protein [Codium arabicum]